MINCRSTLPRIVSFTSLFSGDVRAQENPQLAVVHTVMMREHNRIARALKQLNPLWSEEVLFQETRSIVIAELHHITYTEYLPAMLGKHAALIISKVYTGVHKVGTSYININIFVWRTGEQAMRDYNLNPSATDAYSTYDETTAGDPSVWNEFAAAVFRVGHSQVQGTLV